ncbi:unnamed protein product [Darwinula stevensoni]|uniref:Rhodanese domain-containing protein n=1 Tax=Darwinula stevensoni TaxID=69355 RepID=A0A7R9A8K1_9CRUS|nr:unnamed protein product [Darwinula stevensoni]CAG0896421.1 unnamed protein product [Darwinula stevensoni]
MKDQKTLFIDVRNREEFQRTSSIPRAVNFPWTDIASDVRLPPIDFYRRHGFFLPTSNYHRIVVFGQNLAQRMLEAFGYEDPLAYLGGITDWVSHFGSTEKIRKGDGGESDSTDRFARPHERMRFSESDDRTRPLEHGDRARPLEHGDRARPSEQGDRVRFSEPMHQTRVVASQDIKGRVDVSYEELLERMKDQKTLFIDVRNREEFQRTSSIPRAVNFPWTDIASDVRLPPIDFYRRHGFFLPTSNYHRIVVFGQNVTQGLRALELFHSASYPVCDVYAGLDDWRRRSSPGLVDDDRVGNHVDSEDRRRVLERESQREKERGERETKGKAIRESRPRMSSSLLAKVDLKVLPEPMDDEVNVVLVGYNTTVIAGAVRSLQRLGYNNIFIFAADKETQTFPRTEAANRIRTARKEEAPPDLVTRTSNSFFTQPLRESQSSTPAVEKNEEEIDFKTLYKLVSSGEAKVIEVRSAAAVRRFGKIPVWDLREVLIMDPELFEAKYGFKKPLRDGSDLVVSCDRDEVGREALRRLQILRYDNALLFPGCFQEWMDNGGPVEHLGPSRITPSELQRLMARGNAYVLDVGDPELENRKPFPRSVQIPCENPLIPPFYANLLCQHFSQLPTALNLSAQDFQVIYSHPRPDPAGKETIVVTAPNAQTILDAAKVLMQHGNHNDRTTRPNAHAQLSAWVGVPVFHENTHFPSSPGG